MMIKRVLPRGSSKGFFQGVLPRGSSKGFFQGVLPRGSSKGFFQGVLRSGIGNNWDARNPAEKPCCDEMRRRLTSGLGQV